ncbi:MAG: DNA topoisomerase IB [Methylophilaceae bacterium]|jgi:DNA topoisomerase-1
MAFAAKSGQLEYMHDGEPGYTRKRRGRNFSYIDQFGKTIKDPIELSRIKSLSIPPAWTEVWICPLPEGHLQATGRDAKQRKQYKYHKIWREIRDDIKYEHMIDFGQQLPVIRQQIDIDIASSGLDRQKVLATILSLLENTLIRIGNIEYARDNNSFGLTTMRNRHVEVSGSNIEFHFKGKSKVEHTIKLRDRRLARIIQRIKYLPGSEVFQYVDEQGDLHILHSSDVNDYLRDITGQNYTAKDFRTWYGTLHTAASLRTMKKFETQKEAKANITKAIEFTAEKLGNTPAICRKSYVHPLLIRAYLAGEMHDLIQKSVELPPNKLMSWMEQHLLHLLQSNRCRKIGM